MMTDLITFAFSMFLWIRGFSRGFMNTLINPFSIIVTSSLSAIYYQDHPKDWVISLSIGIIGPFILTFVIKSLLRTIAKATDTDIKPGLISRLAGSIISIAWGWVFVVFILIPIALLPPLWGKMWIAVHDDVIKSMSYNSVAKPLEKDIFTMLAAGDPFLSKKVSSLFDNASKNNAPTTTATDTPVNSDTRSLAEDPRFQEVMQDPEVKKDIDTHDFVKLMSNPKVMALTEKIMTDPATLHKVMELYSNQAKPQAIPPSSGSSS